MIYISLLKKKKHDIKKTQIKRLHIKIHYITLLKKNNIKKIIKTQEKKHENLNLQP